MIDPMLSLAFTVHANPGVYALMLGSGVSRSAGIPTGWEVVLDIVRKLAALRGEKCEPDEESWYYKTFGAAPNYSNLLKELAKTPAERKQLLSPYFQPTPEEREEGRKISTRAHHAIAQLIAQGFFRVVLTTNFDTLMEDALIAAGVTPYVVRHASDIAGAPPLSQSGCQVIKLHGDYLDTRIRNTPEELEKYESAQRKLLDRVVDEFGLIVCGWSTESDTALRDAIARCKSRRYMTYWAYMGPLRAEAQHLIALRAAQTIAIDGADGFFGDLEEKITALRDFDQPHPLTAKVAVATVKRFLSDHSHRIRLHDLVQGETERAAALLTDANFPLQGIQFTELTVSQRLEAYRVHLGTLLPLFATGCYWGEPENTHLWVASLERIANVNDALAGLVTWISLQSYPALLLQYAGGISAIANNRFGTLDALFTKPRRWTNGNEVSFIKALHPEMVLGESAKLLSPLSRAYVPGSEYLFQMLREPLADLIPDSRRYEEHFDRFEYMRSIWYGWLANQPFEREGTVYRKAPVGRFGWKRNNRPEIGIQTTLDSEVTSGALTEFLTTSATFKSVSLPDTFSPSFIERKLCPDR